MRAQWRWPVGMPLCRPMGGGLREIRTDLPTKRTARVLLCVYREHLVALHGFIKKSRSTQDEDLALARKRKKELER
jgi:phage-related protein